MRLANGLIQTHTTKGLCASTSIARIVRNSGLVPMIAVTFGSGKTMNDIGIIALLIIWMRSVSWLIDDWNERKDDE